MYRKKIEISWFFLQRISCAEGLRCLPQQKLVTISTACLLTSPHPPAAATFSFSSLPLLPLHHSFGLLRICSSICHPSPTGILLLSIPRVAVQACLWLTIIMNSLVATPPVPPHFYEYSRLSPSRSSMFPDGPFSSWYLLL